jgi:hypothetical protein
VVGAAFDHLLVVHRGQLRSRRRATLAEAVSWSRSRARPAVLSGWPLRSLSPVWFARGASPVNDLNAAALRNRPARPIAAARTGPPIVATPGRLRVSPLRSTASYACSRAWAWAGCSAIAARSSRTSGDLGGDVGERHRRVVAVHRQRLTRRSDPRPRSNGSMVTSGDLHEAW